VEHLRPSQYEVHDDAGQHGLPDSLGHLPARNFYLIIRIAFNRKPSQPDQASCCPDEVEGTVGVPDKLTAVELSNLTAASLDKVNDGAAEDNRIATAAAALPPAVPKESRDPEREEADPDGRRSHQVVEPVLTRVNISHIVRSVVIIRSVVRWRGGAAPVIINTNT